MSRYVYLSVLLVAGCTSSPSPAQFTDVASEAGVDFVHVQADSVRYHMPEIMAGGTAWLDADGDGWLDLYLVQGGALGGTNPHTNRLYRNDGDGTFTDITAASGTGDTGYGAGAAVGDYDGDGDDDLYAVNTGPNVLYRNDGDGTFTDVTTASGTGDAGWSTSASFFDADSDGDLDLYVVNYVFWSLAANKTCLIGGTLDYCGPDSYPHQTDTFYRNNGDGTYTDATIPAGIATARGAGLGLVTADLDRDGDLDVYVANDGAPNQLWRNDGDGTFTDIGVASGSAVNGRGQSEAGMGVTAFDLENDGDLDLLLAHLTGETNTLYRADDGFYTDATALTGLAASSIPFTAFGIGAADFDHDGHQDVFIANGRVKLDGNVPADPGDPYAQRNQFYRGHGDGTFEEVQPDAEPVLATEATSRAAAFADYDNDGDVDVVVVNSGGAVELLRNERTTGHWLQLDVRDANGQVAIGAMVGVTAGGRTQWRVVQRAYSYQSSNDPRVHFGLGDADTVERIELIWPDGTREIRPALPVDTRHRIQRGGA